MQNQSQRNAVFTRAIPSTAMEDSEMPKSTTQSILVALQADRRASGVFDAPDHDHQIKIYFQMQVSMIRLRGVLCGADCRPISGAHDVTRTITSEKLLATAIDTMIHAVWHKWETQENAKKPHCKMQRGRVSNFFQVVQFDPADLGWAQSTYDGTLSYLRDSIAPRMDSIGEDLCNEDLKKIADDLIERACKSGRGKTDADGRASEKDAAAARQQVIVKLDRCRRLYELARSQYPQSGLPDVQFPVFERIKVSKVEQSKELPADTRVVLANMLWLLANQGDARAYNAALMLYVGLRTGEAAAPKIGDIALADDDKYGSYFVAGKIRNGIYEPYPKTQAGYRTIILGSEMVQFVRLRIQQLQAQGYTAQEIENIPLGTTNDSDLSAYIRKLLLLAGCNSQIITDSTAEAMQLDSTDVSAYVLRRDWATRMANCCGMPMDMLDKLLGHVRRDNTKRDYTTPAQQQRIAAIIDRCVLLPQLSQSSDIQPMILPNNASLVLDENIRHQFVAREDCTVNLDIQALEPGQLLIITAPRDALQIQHVRLLTAKPAQRGTTILQSCEPNCGFGACLLRAEQIMRKRRQFEMENVKFLKIKSRYNEQKQHCSLTGTFMICGIEGRFEVHTVGNCRTHVTGRVSLISPLDGKILLFDGAHRRELIAKRTEDQKARIRAAKRPRELKATKELDVEIIGVDFDPKTHVVIFPQDSVHMIQNAIKSKAEKLYAEAQPTLARMLEQQGPWQNVTALQIYYTRAKGSFAAEAPVKDATRRRNSNSLQKMCAALGEKAIADISPRDVKQLTVNFSRTEVHRLERFLSYCREKGDFSCANPVTEYAPAQKHARNYSAERTRAARMHGISLEAERTLLKLAEDHIVDGRVCAIAFALGAGLGIDEMLRLRWSDVQCKNNQVYLELQSDNSGATHNYSRPPLPFAQEILQARCDWLHEHYTRGFSNFPVVSDRDDPRKSISRSALTDFIRASFQRCGVRFSALKPEESTSKQIGGTGIRLAKEHYENVLEQICGIPADSQESRYLCGKPMDTVTADCYRGLSGISGRSYLETVVRRDMRFSDHAVDGYTVDEEDIVNGMCRYTICPNNSAAQIGLIAELRLKSDDRMSIESTNGLAGILKAK